MSTKTTKKLAAAAALTAILLTGPLAGVASATTVQANTSRNIYCIFHPRQCLP